VNDRIGAAVHTYPFRACSLETALDEVVALGRRRVELWLGHVGGDPARVREELDERGLVLAALSIGGVYRPDAPLLARLGGLVDDLGADRVVGCVSPGLLPLLREAVPRGAAVLVENHWDQALCTPGALLEELDGVEGAWACVDTGHALLAGWSPTAFVSALGGRARHVHLKDARRPRLAVRCLGRRLRRRLLPRPEATVPGSGELDVPALLAVLGAEGFDGALTVEDEGPEPREGLRRLLAELAAATV
jgi:sugar phosphate isomerase/epimerase